ncbi:uncharacterized protein F4822DRAFT_39283 [Hypoxylon trugodes]|uniref:uncharacterized protein n=1 Tax=Hypoxylon trugodes TaxID=326681 RepID=UPI00219F32AC|nr:uncharacterized protein F4822DRAFT_39283 [Hypoxylon trugodes]KAI1394166.1 hypothetical protein F4822DRAFT_39283 [Hypoxylon trugodes]
MAIFLSGTEARLGALNIAPAVLLPPLPNIVSEWSSIVPLICHLASVRDDYKTTGDVALLGRVSIGLFPKLGTLAGLSRLLSQGPDYLDQASTRGGSSRTVWDVQWGSVFPLANGAASAAIVEYARHRHAQKHTRIPEAVPSPKDNKPRTVQEKSTTSSSSSDGDYQKSAHKPLVTEKWRPLSERQFRRYQTLYVLRFKRERKTTGRNFKFEDIGQTTTFHVFSFIVLISIAVALSFVGSYGTAVVIIMSAISRITTQRVSVLRPTGYLQNNESHDACMLVAPHQNANVWYLYVGDRSIVDTLLNKPMLAVPQNQYNWLVAKWLAFAHLLHIAAMTFTAGQRGWDGVCMVALLAIDRVLRWHFCTKTYARDWLEREGYTVDIESFEFSGRAPMIGAIQLYSGSKVTRWMDDIFVPHPRRDAWLENMINGGEIKGLPSHDVEWVRRATYLSQTGARIMKEKLNWQGV